MLSIVCYLGAGSAFFTCVTESVTQLCLTDCDPMDCSPQGSSRQGYWIGLPFSSPGNVPDPVTEPGSPALQADSLLTELAGKPICVIRAGWIVTQLFAKWMNIRSISNGDQ